MKDCSLLFWVAESKHWNQPRFGTETNHFRGSEGVYCDQQYQMPWISPRQRD